MPDTPTVPINPSGTSGVDVNGQPVQSLLQMAQGAQQAPPGGWAPQWVRDQLPTNIAYFNSMNRGPNGEALTGLDPFSGGVGSLAPYYNPDNWGPPPAPGSGSGGGGSGWFPEFNNLGPNNPNEKFWTMKAFASQLPGGPGGAAGDESPNTRNWRLMQGVRPGQNTLPGGGAAEPGNFMYLGHPISQNKLYYDTHRPVDTQEGAGIVGGSFLPYHGFGNQGSGWSTKGQVGFPGQLDPFATSWGAGGPGG